MKFLEIIFKVIGIALITTITTLVVKQTKPEMAMLIGVSGSIILFIYIVDLIEQVFGIFSYMLDATKINSELFVILLKIIGIGYITEFSANICNDSNSASMASKILLAGKLTIFILAIPIIKSLIDMIVSILP